MNYIELTGPEGKILIDKDKIVAIYECDILCVNKKKIKTLFYILNSEEPFIILEDYETVKSLI